MSTLGATGSNPIADDYSEPMIAQLHFSPNGKQHFCYQIVHDGTILAESRPIPNSISRSQAADLFRRHCGIAHFYRIEAIAPSRWVLRIVDSHSVTIAQSPEQPDAASVHALMSRCLTEGPHAIAAEPARA